MKTPNREKWDETYLEQLKLAIENYPDEYVYSADLVPVVYSRMTEAFSEGSFNKDGRAIKATCRHFRINHTYKAIKAFWGV